METEIESEVAPKQFRRDPELLPFVFRIPHKIRRENGTAYSPQLVSIGPLHYNKRALIPMEKNKLRYMMSFHSRSACNCNDVYDRCIRVIQSREDLVRNFYAEDISLSSSELAKVLVVDGSFILELFMKAMHPHMNLENDPIFNTAWMLPSLRRDLLLLENQIPFSVLEELSKVVGGDLVNLMESTHNFFRPGLGQIKKTPKELCPSAGQHLLDILRICYVPESIRIEDDVGKQKLNWQYIRRATALIDVGVNFQCHTSENLFDIQFNKRGIFKIPELVIHENTEVLFRNLIFLEQLRHGCLQYITSYALLISGLLGDDEDVKILEQKKILKIALGPGQDVFSVFKDLCKGISLREFYFSEIFDDMDQFCEKRMRKYRAMIIREYLKEPWAIASLIAVFMFAGVVPIIQTIYTVLSYYKQP